MCEYVQYRTAITKKTISNVYFINRHAGQRNTPQISFYKSTYIERKRLNGKRKGKEEEKVGSKKGVGK